jgi:hypothetical protein
MSNVTAVPESFPHTWRAPPRRGLCGSRGLRPVSIRTTVRRQARPRREWTSLNAAPSDASAATPCGSPGQATIPFYDPFWRRRIRQRVGQHAHGGRHF